jgi:hypothetical protein
MEGCPICTRPAYSPYRVYDERGRVVLGCVAAFHDDALRGIVGESSRWHFRPAAKAIRRTLRIAQVGR